MYLVAEKKQPCQESGAVREGGMGWHTMAPEVECRGCLVAGAGCALGGSKRRGMWPHDA